MNILYGLCDIKAGREPERPRECVCVCVSV